MTGIETLPGVALLLAPTYRSRAIVQTMAAEGLGPSRCLRLPGREPVWDGDETVTVPLHHGVPPRLFRPGRTLDADLAGWNAPVETAPTADVNDPAFIGWLARMPEETVVYSGVAGCILRKPLLSCGKRFIHAHGGDAPRYSGSTAFYFSLLEENSIAATVFWMDEGLDTGTIILRNPCTPPRGVEIDRIVDPMMRADALVRALRLIAAGGAGDGGGNQRPRRVYYVVHPVLKHLALGRCGLV